MSLDAGSVIAQLGAAVDPRAFATYERALKRSVADATSAERQFVASSDRQSKAMTALGKTAKVAATAGLVGVGVAAAGAAGALVGAARKAMTFEKQMAGLKAVSGASTKQMQAMSKQALELGASTGLGAGKAAQALTELAKGGVAVKDIGSALKGTLDLAAAGELEVADAATITANALNLFALEGKDATTVADAFATAANATTADVGDFGMALSQGGAAAKAAGLSFHDTVVALEAMAAAGVKNSDAGTSLKAALTQLANPTDKQAEATKKLGLNFFTAEGKFKDLSDVSKMLGDKFDGLTKKQKLQAASTIAGTDGMRALLALYDAGPKKIEGFERGIANQGSAAKVGAEKMEGAAGAIQKLKASFETAQIIVGQELLPIIAREAEKAADKLTELAESGDLKKFGQDVATGVEDGIEALKNFAAEAEKSIDPIKETVDKGIDLGKFIKLGDLVEGGPLNVLKGYLDDVKDKAEQAGSKEVKIKTSAPGVAKTLEELRQLGEIGGPRGMFDKTVKVLYSGASAEEKVQALRRLKLPDKLLRMLAQTGDAETKLRRVKSYLDSVQSKTVTLTVNEQRNNMGSARRTSKVQPQAARAAGVKTNGPELALIGEGGGPEYVIPTEPRYRGRALDLFAQLAKDLGIPGYKAGTKTTPFKLPVDRLETRESDSRTALQKNTDAQKDLPKKIDQAEASLRDIGRRKPRNKAQRENKADDLRRSQKKLRDLRKDLRDAKKNEAAARREWNTSKRELANAKRYQAQITEQEDLADIADNDLTLAARRKDKAGVTTAKKAKKDALDKRRSLIAAALAATTDAVFKRDLQKTLGAIDIAIEDLNDPVAAPDSLEEFFTEDERTRLGGLDVALADAEGTKTTVDDLDALSGILGVQEGALGRLRGTAPSSVVATLVRDINANKSRISDLGRGGGGSDDPDLVAQLEQERRRTASAQSAADINAAALRVFSGGDGGSQITINTLHPGDPATLTAIGNAAVSGMGFQKFRRPSSIPVGL